MLAEDGSLLCSKPRPGPLWSDADTTSSLWSTVCGRLPLNKAGESISMANARVLRTSQDSVLYSTVSADSTVLWTLMESSSSGVLSTTSAV